jgi:hypothetical protein
MHQTFDLQVDSRPVGLTALLRPETLMKTLSTLCFLGLAAVAVCSPARAADGCPAGTFSAITSPDGTTLSILFDSFMVSGGAGGDAVRRQACDLQVPLRLPEGYSLGVYRVDYRGFAHLSGKETADLRVDYGLGPRDKGRRFQRKIKGRHDSDFIFTENIGAGLMRRVGCGETAVLNVSLQLTLNADNPSEAMATLDSADGAPKGGIIYHLNTRKCRP